MTMQTLMITGLGGVGKQSMLYKLAAANGRVFVIDGATFVDSGQSFVFVGLLNPKKLAAVAVANVTDAVDAGALVGELADWCRAHDKPLVMSGLRREIIDQSLSMLPAGALGEVIEVNFSGPSGLKGVDVIKGGVRKTLTAKNWMAGLMKLFKR